MTTVTTPDPQSELPGRIMAREMAEQPAVLCRILNEGAPAIRKVAQEIAARAPRFVLLTARGTSDNAALYAKYLLEIRLGLGVPGGRAPVSGCPDCRQLCDHAGACSRVMPSTHGCRARLPVPVPVPVSWSRPAGLRRRARHKAGSGTEGLAEVAAIRLSAGSAVILPSRRCAAP